MAARNISKEIQAGLKEFAEIAEGTRLPARTTTVMVVSAREVRRVTGLSQGDFSARYNIPVRTLQGWEAGKSPSATEQSYLAIIAEMPDQVATLVASAKEKRFEDA